MKLQTKATQVALRTSQLMQAGAKLGGAINQPIWYGVMLSHPPTHQLLPKMRTLKQYVDADRKPTETTPQGMFVTRNKKKYSTQASHLYKLPKIQYPEDKIRKKFYTNHAWELARPRNVVETSGKSLSGRDWSSIQQKGLRLSGEHVVQRTLWLANQPEYKAEHGSDWYEAYKQARLEFYRLRITEHAEQEVAAEEALMSGAVFGTSAIEFNLNKEQEHIDKYVETAVEETKRREAARDEES